MALPDGVLMETMLKESIPCSVHVNRKNVCFSMFIGVSFGGLLSIVLCTGYARQRLTADETSISMASQHVQPLRAQQFMKPAKVQLPMQQRVAHVPRSGRWAGLDEDISDDQQDITRGRNMVDSLYQGGAYGTSGTHNAVMASGTDKASYRRSWDKTDSKDGLYISPEFLDKMTVHIAKNFMDLPNVKVPLILGIWGGKGEGKTFQTELAYRRLNIDPVVMSAGELESDNAGEPAKLVRQRYREASDIIKKGQLCSLFINDLDAGAGRLNDKTQYTVNNQLVSATLMNIADNPHNVQLPGMYQKSEIPRVPIVCTGNDFSTLYAPLIRDGRMDKFFWNPTRDDRVGVCMGIFRNDTISKADIEKLVDSFPGQTIDFFGALRAKAYDDKVRSFIAEHGHENLGKQLVNRRGGKIQMDVICDVNALMQYGNALAQQQDNVKRVRLADSYLQGEF